VPGQEFRHDRPDRCVVGTIGEPGQRTFYLQARTGSLLTSVVLEKTQVAALADRMSELLDSVLRRTGGTAPVPVETPATVDDLGPLDIPLDEEFRVGTMSLTWLGEDDRLEVVATAVSTDPEGETPQDDLDVLTFRLTGAQARAFVSRARAVVAAGRPPCPLCSQPLDPAGHVCPRLNGFRRRA
jgi:uncharacterized repeat protein (TIGR03847 family)